MALLVKDGILLGYTGEIDEHIVIPNTVKELIL